MLSLILRVVGRCYRSYLRLCDGSRSRAQAVPDRIEFDTNYPFY